ncbi:MAG TPA: hypothetical protein H9908_02440 [Candidatus Rothia avistercoris]|uniref:Uncharacterized protein n=1 Tax=Candidatus Rothia avistercoris TaxID=2840479 RepID=A0A9D2UDZ9_9MICC|nr:hypothetical protein [Candidatus Rothia avistercoris]
MTTITDLAKVISIGPDSIEIEITSTDKYEDLEEKPQIGSYLQISDGDGSSGKLVAVVQGFRVKDSLGNDEGDNEAYSKVPPAAKNTNPRTTANTRPYNPNGRLNPV